MTVDLVGIATPTSYATDADYRAYGSALSAQIARIGLVKSSDTGQVDWTTATIAVGGYEIWRFNDALQATKPVYLKITYPTAKPAITVSVGTGTNGAGTLTGQTTSARALAGGGGSSGVTPSYASGGPNRLSLVNMYINSQNNVTEAIFLERTKTPDGVDTDDGFVFGSMAGGGGLEYRAIPFSGSVPTASGYFAAIPLLLGASQQGIYAALSPVMAFLGKPLWTSMLAYNLNDLGALTPIKVFHLGALRTVMPFGAMCTTTSFAQGQSAGYALATLWE